jgi:hypothetical protein
MRILPKINVLFYVFLWTKGLNVKDINKEMSSVYTGKWLLHEALHSLVKKRDRRFPDDEETESEVKKWLRQQLKEFRRTGKAMGQV